jgi:hypothetical protein
MILKLGLLAGEWQIRSHLHGAGWFVSVQNGLRKVCGAKRFVLFIRMVTGQSLLCRQEGFEF